MLLGKIAVAEMHLFGGFTGISISSGRAAVCDV